MSPSLSLIFDRSRNHCIGLSGDLPWHLPRDYQFFSDTTTGSTVIMGRRTYEDHRSRFPDRHNIVITRTASYAVVDGVVVASDLDNAIALSLPDKPVFIIGGSGLFERAMPRATTVYETIVEADIDGDTFLPQFNFDGWQSTEVLHQEQDSEHQYAFTTWRRDRHQDNPED